MTRWPWPRPLSTHADARDALSQSTSDLLGAVHTHREASEIAAQLRDVERRNHLAESVRNAFRESR